MPTLIDQVDDVRKRFLLRGQGGAPTWKDVHVLLMAFTRQEAELHSMRHTLEQYKAIRKTFLATEQKVLSEISLFSKEGDTNAD